MFSYVTVINEVVASMVITMNATTHLECFQYMLNWAKFHLSVR